jgi:hypothetical protein
MIEINVLKRILKNAYAQFDDGSITGFDHHSSAYVVSYGLPTFSNK